MKKQILKELEKLWLKMPELRLGQLIVNLNNGVDPFYMEDVDLLKNILSFNGKYIPGNCPICGNKVDVGSFKDALSKKEYEISGMCQKCQDDFFG